MVRMTVAVIFAFVLFVILHFLQFHYFPPQEKAAAVLGMALFGAAIYGVTYFLLPAEDRIRSILRIPKGILKIFPVLLGVVLYALLFIGYLEFYFTADRSITFRMLRIIDEQPQQSVTAEQMLVLYDTKAIIHRRFEDLVYGGYLQKDGDHFILTSKGQRTLKLYRFTIDYLHLGKF